MSELKVWEKSLRSGHQKFIKTYGIDGDAIPEHVKKKATQEVGFAYQMMLDNEMLQKCNPQSIVNAVTNIARTSITLNPVMKLAYLVPRNGKCVLDFSYMGLISLLKNNGNIKTINAYIVYEDEEFKHDIVNNIIYHEPKYVQTELEHNERKIIGAYSVAKLPNNEVDYSFMPMWEIDKVKNSSKGSDSKYSPWNTWRDEMIKKTVIKRHFKMLISIDDSANNYIASALEIEHDNNPFKEDYSFKKEQKDSLKNAFVEEEVKEDSKESRVNQIVDYEEATIVEETEQDNTSQSNVPNKEQKDQKDQNKEAKKTTKSKKQSESKVVKKATNGPKNPEVSSMEFSDEDMNLFDDPNQLRID